MLTSLALIIFLGLGLGRIFEKLNLPRLVGMLITGIVLGPSVLNLISPDILNIAPDLREIALIIILVRAGLSLDLGDLRSIGRPALLMCFVPAAFEITAVTLIAPLVFGMSYLEAAVMGCVLAPVSAAVVVPYMLKLMGNGYGTDKKIPQLIMAGTSVDDVFVIVLLTSLTGLYKGDRFNAVSFLKIPASILLGVAFGVAVGFVLNFVFKKVKLQPTAKLLIVLAAAFLLLTFENSVPQVPVSSLLAIMVAGAVILKKSPETASRLSAGFTQVWMAAELMLFVLVGCAVCVEYIGHAGVATMVVLICGSLLRFFGVFLCLVKTNITFKERVFCAVAYIPKATVQAAMGAIPLSMGMASGETTLTVAVLAILILAPTGAFLIGRLYPLLLNKEE